MLHIYSTFCPALDPRLCCQDEAGKAGRYLNTNEMALHSLPFMRYCNIVEPPVIRRGLFT